MIESMKDSEIIQVVYSIKEMPIEQCVEAMRKFARCYAIRENSARNSRRSGTRYEKERRDGDSPKERKGCV
jgi:hypothetical protein